MSGYKKLSLTELMDIEVTSVSRRVEKLAETASAIQVITGEDIRRSGATSIPGALRLASNLAVAQIDSNRWAITARGMNSTIADKLLVMIDGRTVYTPLYAGVFWDAQDTLLEDLDHIEVISGPGGTLWGANAVNGVINVTTKRARDTQGILLLGGGGTELRGLAGIRYGGTLAPALHYRVYAKYSDRDSSLRPDGTDGNNSWHMGQGGFRLDWEPSGNLITLQGDVYGGRADQPGIRDTITAGGNLLGRWTHTFSPDSNFQIQWYYDRTERDIAGSIREELDTHDLDLQHQFIIGGRHNVVWGLGYRLTDDHVVNPPVLAFLPGDLVQETFSGFVQDEVALVANRLTLTLGTKIEHNDYTGWEYQPSARLSWKATPTQTVWSAISRAVRTPARIDRDIYAPRDPPFVIVQGGPDFHSETLVAYELGYRAQPAARLSLSVAAFYNDYDDIRSVEQVNPPAARPLIIRNGLEGETYGAELTADYRVSEFWRLQGGYTRLIVRLRAKPGSHEIGAGLSDASDAGNQIFLRSSFDLPWDLEFDAGVRHVGDVANQGPPAYEELEMRIGWRPTPRLELSIVGQNLLDARHPEFGTPASRHEIQRSVHAKILWRY